MDSQRTLRRNDIDLLKGIAIISVVLYHMGILESGYLGVDVFFVIAGFLTVPRTVKEIENNCFSYKKFIWNRVIRLLPSICIVAAICLSIEYFLALPDDYENLSESVIASVAFSNNILSAITTKNYWNEANDYKALMHMWYLGILMEFYFIFPIIAIIAGRLSNKFKWNAGNTVRGGYCILTLVTLLLFLSPGFSAGDKFYLIPFRFYELMIGGLIGIYEDRLKRIKLFQKNWTLGISFGLLLCTLCIGAIKMLSESIGASAIGPDLKSGSLLVPNNILILVIVLLTADLLIIGQNNVIFNKRHYVVAIGKRSYSIFIWHQVMLALYRYSISSEITLWSITVFFFCLSLVSELNYRYIEKKVKVSARSSFITIVTAILLCSISLIIYMRAGVVRNVPELGIRTDDVHRNMHAEYCDRIYDYDVEFKSDNKVKVLLVGNSYARDFGNILLESEYNNNIELTYSFSFEDSLIDRIEQADRVFVFGYKDDVPDYLWENVKDKGIVYGIGTKSYGETNGQIYFKRFNDNYFLQTTKLDPEYEAINNKMKSEWGDHYIDLLEAVTYNGRVRVFTDTNMFISQDTKHLTKAGAQFYSKILELNDILPNKYNDTKTL